MTVRRIVPDIAAPDPQSGRDFYTDILGLEVAMDLGCVVTFASPANPTAQITVAVAPHGEVRPDYSVEIADVDACHARALARGLPILYGPVTEPWHVRRFFVRDPHGRIANILSHAGEPDAAAGDAMPRHPVTYPIAGRCTCGEIRFRLTGPALFVHGCHCRWCQRETGSAFATNAMIEADRVDLLAGVPEIVVTPSNSGKGQKIARCPACRIALWSNYAGAGEAIRFVRVGTLDDPDRLPPDIHIFTASKQPWVVLPAGTPAVPDYYDHARFWPETSLRRLSALLARENGGS